MVDKTFQDVCRFMYDYRWEYINLDSKALTDSKAQNGRLIHDPFEFKVIILPAVSTLPSKAWERLLEHIKQTSQAGRFALIE